MEDEREATIAAAQAEAPHLENVIHNPDGGVWYKGKFYGGAEYRLDDRYRPAPLDWPRPTALDLDFEPGAEVFAGIFGPPRKGAAGIRFEVSLDAAPAIATLNAVIERVNALAVPYNRVTLSIPGYHLLRRTAHRALAQRTSAHHQRRNHRWRHR